MLYWFNKGSEANDDSESGIRRSAVVQVITDQDLRDIPGVLDFREDHSVLIFIEEASVEEEVKDLFSPAVLVEFQIEGVDYDRSASF